MLKVEAGETVTYRRGVLSRSITAIPGRETRNVIGDEGIAMATDEMHFIVAPADLVLGGSVTLPERGDEIVRTVGNETLTYTVRVEGGLDRYSIDPTASALRIRTKLKGRA